MIRCQLSLTPQRVSPSTLVLKCFLSVMQEYYNFSNGRKNPHAATIKQQGNSITVHYSPQDIEEGDFDDTTHLIVYKPLVFARFTVRTRWKKISVSSLSIKSIAEKYDGTASFHWDKGERMFDSRVSLTA